MSATESDYPDQTVIHRLRRILRDVAALKGHENLAGDDFMWMYHLFRPPKRKFLTKDTPLFQHTADCEEHARSLLPLKSLRLAIIEQQTLHGERQCLYHESAAFLHLQEEKQRQKDKIRDREIEESRQEYLRNQPLYARLAENCRQLTLKRKR